MMLDETLILPFTFPEPHSRLGGLATLAEDGLELEFQSRFFFMVRESVRKIPFTEIRDVHVQLARPAWFQPKIVFVEISMRSLRPLQGVPGREREKLRLCTQKENLDLARCLEQVLLLKLISR